MPLGETHGDAPAKSVQTTPAAVFPSLPADDVTAQIFLLLPVPDHLRCREVSPAWRAFLAQPQFWRVLDLSAAAMPATMERLRLRKYRGIGCGARSGTRTGSASARSSPRRRARRRPPARLWR